MVISAEGSGDRSLFVSYISEVPMWKATYRIVLNAKKPPLLQGWAIVDNTVGQDWEKVQLSLVAGAPQSFIQNLSQPYYSRRPVVALPEMAAIAPQTYEATLIGGNGTVAGVVKDQTGAVIAGSHVKVFDSNGTLAGETITDGVGRYELAVPPGGARLEVEHAGFQKTVINGVAGNSKNDVQLRIGSTNMSVTVEAAASNVNTESSSIMGRYARNLGSGGGLGGVQQGLVSKTDRFTRSDGTHLGVGAPNLAEARQQLQAAASAQELGDLFEYKLKDPITILKNRSALVPIVQSAIAADKVSVWNERAGLARPQRALWLNNTSGLTLDGGSFSVLEEETFAGEGLFDPIKPGEKRLVSYATDLALNVRAKSDIDQQRVTRVRILRGVMTMHNEAIESKTYTFRNEDSSPRTVIVEHPVRAGFELRSETKPAEITSAWMRFELRVDPKQTASLAVKEAQPMQTTYQISNINEETMGMFVRQKSIDKSIEDALRKVLAAKAQVEAIDEQKEAREKDTQKIFDDQQRLRENMKALKGSPEEKSLLQRYTKQLNDQEDRLEKLRKEIEDLEAKSEKAQEALDKMIEDLSFDVRV